MADLFDRAHGTVAMKALPLEILEGAFVLPRFAVNEIPVKLVRSETHGNLPMDQVWVQWVRTMVMALWSR